MPPPQTSQLDLTSCCEHPRETVTAVRIGPGPIQTVETCDIHLREERYRDLGGFEDVEVV
jgi:hypothetical protein